MAFNIIHLVSNLPGLIIEVVDFAHFVWQDQSKQVDFYLFYTAKGLLFLFLSVQLAQDPRDTGVSRNEKGLLKQTYWKKICQVGC